MSTFVFSNAAIALLTAAITAGATTLPITPSRAANFAAPTAGQVQRLIIADDSGNFELVDVTTNALDGNLTVTRGVESSTARIWPAGSQVMQFLSQAVITSIIGANQQYLNGLTAAADKVPYFDTSSSMALASFTAAGRALAGGANAAAQKTTLSLNNVDNKSEATLFSDLLGSARTFSSTLSASDITSSRTAAPTQGYLFLGNSGAKYVGFDGTSFAIQGANVGIGSNLVVAGSQISLGSGGGNTNFFLNSAALGGAGLNFQNAGVSKWVLGKSVLTSADNFDLYDTVSGPIFSVDLATGVFNQKSGWVATGSLTLQSDSNAILHNNAAATNKWIEGIRSDITGNANDWVLYSATFGLVMQAQQGTGKITVSGAGIKGPVAVSAETSGTLTFASGDCQVNLSAGCTIANSVFPTNCIIIGENLSGGAITITQGAGMTMTLHGSTSTGNRTLAQNGSFKIKFTSSSACIISGDVS